MLRVPGDLDVVFRFASKYFGVRAHSVQRGSFALMRLFLERISNMTRQRLDAIERISLRVAESSIWKDSVDRLFRARNVIAALLEISDRMLRRNESALKCEDVYSAFDIVSDDDSTGRDTYFVRDLILLKILEIKGQAALPEQAVEPDTAQVN